MTLKKQEQIFVSATLFYRAFPVSVMTVNHKIIIEACELIKKVFEYKGHTKTLPKELLEMKYNSFWNSLQELREKVDRGSIASKEALKAISDAEELLDWIFI